MTIGEEKRIWEKTGGNPNPDVKVLLTNVVDTFQRYGYGGSIHTPDFSRTTFHPLKVADTIDDAVEKYLLDGDDAVDPTFVDLIDVTRKYNLKCNYENNMKKINVIKVMEYVNFLHLASRAVRDIPYRSETTLIRQRWRKLWKKTPIEVPDKRSIVVVTNPAKDGLIKCFNEQLANAAKYLNRGLRFIYIGNNQGEELRDFYFNSEIKDIDYVEAKFNNLKDAYSGIWTDKSYVKVSFRRETALFGLENDVDGEMYMGCIADSHHKRMIHLFDRLKTNEGL